MIKKIERLLIANRGEIAIRICRAATELGITTICLYTHEDRYSLHRYKADEAYKIGKDTEALKPYLDIDEILYIAKREKVHAIHPGYGFLSENVAFAEKCREAGIIFIGPDPEVMAQLGDKVAAKSVAIAAGVPIILGNTQPLETLDIALAEANHIGYPVIVKASAGGGGRGMRICHDATDLQRAYTEARREAMTAFGDDTIFIEKYIENPKHIEVQILGDNYGNIVHLFERDCSVQRRFQKIIEIAPAPALLQSTKEELYRHALAIAHSVRYNNAGTVEFLVDAAQRVYFIEVNPRIQVEHTVTEEVTGIDLVRTQILIAAGSALSSSGIFIHSQDDVSCEGFAIQCRITTEDPTNQFKPDYGTIIAYRNATGFGIRLDEGSAYPGAIVSPFFDSMLTKVTASGRTFKGACQRLHRALLEFRIRGVKNNIQFLDNVVQHSVFQNGESTVNFIAEHPELLQFVPRRDRATNLLRYIANVTVNGNLDITSPIEKGKTFATPQLPDYAKREAALSGTRQSLLDLGPEQFAHWVRQHKPLLLTDTTLRDAHQSLLATRVRTFDMLPIAEAYAHLHPQTFSMEVWGGATFDVALRFLHECPWRRLQQLREVVPNILFQMLLRGANGVGYTAYPDNLVGRFVEESWKNGIDVFRIFDSLNWVDNMLESIKTVRERTGAIAEPCICYTGDISNPKEHKYTLQYYLDMAHRLEDAGAHILGIKDMAGLLKPHAAHVLISELKKTLSIPIHLHTHDTSSAQLATYLKAIDAGVDIVDVALASMSGLTSQPNFNTLVAILEGHERAPQYDLLSLNACSNYWETVREYYYPFEGNLKAGTAEVYRHEIPGGQYTNLKPQAQSMGLADQLDDIKQAYIDANELFGGIVKVTPSSKVVGDMAMFMVTSRLSKNDILEKADQLAFPESVKGLLRGELGFPPDGFPKDLQAAVLKGEPPLTNRANAHLAPIDIDAEFAVFKTRFSQDTSFLDFLSFKMYPKVFEQYYLHRQVYGVVDVLPTPPFFFGLQEGEEISIDIAHGKSLLIKLLYVGRADQEGFRRVHFELNGQTRTVKVKDLSVAVHTVVHRKANPAQNNEIGAPLQGKISKIMVKKGDKVAINQPLFVIEAMKMETTVTALSEATVVEAVLSEGTMVAAEDLILVLI